MSAINDLIQVESDGTISFGDYSLSAKAKKDNFEYKGDIYKVKTCKEITKLECNGMFVYESVPGTTVHHFSKTESGVLFKVEGADDAQLTLDLEEGAEYEITINDNSAGVMKANLGGKLSIGVELSDADSVTVKAEKK